MKILSVRPPWSSLMFRPVAPKDIENRVWAAPSAIIGERIAIHSALKLDPAGLPFTDETFQIRASNDRGHVLGTVTVTGCHEAGSRSCTWHSCAENPWAMWPDAEHPVIFHWELEHPHALVTPIKARGALGLWNPDERLAHLLDLGDVKL